MTDPTPATNPSNARVVIFEDRRSPLEGLILYLERHSEFEVVATATSPESARKIVDDTDNIQFDAAIVDLELVPDSEIPHGLELAHRIRGVRPDALVYLWSHYFTEGDLIRRASRVFRGRLLVDGIVSKTSSQADLVKAISIRREYPGVGLWLDPQLQPPANCRSAMDELTSSELRNLRALARRPGATTAELRADIGIERSTWKKQLDFARQRIAHEVIERLRVGARTVFDETDAELITVEMLTRWARERNLHWPILEFELEEGVE